MRVSCLAKGVLLAAVIFAPTSTQAQESSLESRLNALFELLESNDKFMGTVAVSKDGRVIFHRQYGIHADGGKPEERPDQETQYRIGSITKTFTAVMIMQLVEEEKLTLDQKLADFYPELKNAGQIDILQMLGHQSGIGSFTDDPTYGSWHTETMTREKMMEIIARQPEKFEPGTKTEYSNSNFVLLGYIIEKLSGSSYAEQLQIRICDRLGLKRTRYMTNKDANQNVAISFRWTGEKWSAMDQTDPSIPHGAGAIMSTAADLTRFIEALFDGKLVGKTWVDKMTPSGIGMGHGLFAFPFGPHRAFGHNGGIDGFQSNLGHFPEDKISVAVIGNGVNYSINDIMLGILSMVFDRPYELPVFTQVNVAEAELRKYVGTYARENFPLKVTITVHEHALVAQGSGQPSFALTPVSETEFRSDLVGATIAFSRSDGVKAFNTMTLTQAGQKLEFRKE